MTDKSKIADFLNSLIDDQPNLVELLDQGIPANEATRKRDDIYTRPTEDGDNITITGILVAIAKQYGEWMGSGYDEDDNLIKFQAFEGQDKEIAEILLKNRQEKMFRREEFNEIAMYQPTKE